jgi:hypothetical protein
VGAPRRARGNRLAELAHRAISDTGKRGVGAPGIRAHYHENYYGALVRDPDGHNIEAVCHTTQAP